MSTESEASGGGFWRGFFTGVFLLVIATIALIVFFPMSEQMTAPMAVDPTETDAGGSDATEATDTTEDGASIAPVISTPEIASTSEPPAEPQTPTEIATTTESAPETMVQPESPAEIAVQTEAPAATDIAVSEQQAPVAAVTEDAPVIATAQDQAPQVGGSAQISGEPAAEANVVANAPAPAVALVEAPLAPEVKETSDSPVVASVQDQAPAEPVPAPVAENAIIVAEAPQADTEIGTPPAAPSVNADVLAIVPNTSDSEPESNEPSVRIANQSGVGKDTGVSVRSGSEIGRAATTFVANPALGGSSDQDDGSGTKVPAVDDEVKTAMAPISEVPDTGDDAATVDTSTAAHPRQRPEPPIAEGPAFEAFAAEFDDKNTKPLLAIILQDVGDDGLGRDDLISINLPVSFAIAVDDPEAPWSEALYRENGFEVLAMVPETGASAISRGQPGDEVAAKIPQYINAVPGAIGILDQVGGEIQRDNNLVKALIAALKPTGHALLLNKGSGFGSAVDLAKLSNIPSDSIVRVIDTERSPSAIRANLDRAAFLAGQSGSVVVIGRTYPETVTTLVRWLLGGTARSVTVAPVSAALRR